LEGFLWRLFLFALKLRREGTQSLQGAKKRQDLPVEKLKAAAADIHTAALMGEREIYFSKLIFLN
jgi:hypothetical protein